MNRGACVTCFGLGALVLACDEPAPPSLDASVRASPGATSPSTPGGKPLEGSPQLGGCARTGSLEGVESDPACVLEKVSDEAMRDVTKRVAIALELDPPEVIAGATGLLRLSMTNISGAEVLLVFDAHATAPGPRTDWSRLAGVPDVKGERPNVPRLHMTIATTDARERPVDAVPVVANSAPSQTAPRLLGVRLRPGGKLTHTLSWWALRIPAPAPIVKDDAGHRFVPKTTALPLPTGDYVISVDVPFHGLAPAERTVRVGAHVERLKTKAIKKHH